MAIQSILSLETKGSQLTYNSTTTNPLVDRQIYILIGYIEDIIIIHSFKNITYQKLYAEPCQTSKAERFSKIVNE